MISVPWLIFLWLSPIHAVANITAAALWDVIWSSIKFYRTWKIKSKFVRHIVAVGVLWSIVWINVLTSIDPGVMIKMVWVVLVLLIPLLFIDIETFEVSSAVSSTRQMFWFLLLFVIWIYTTIFNANAWLLALFTLIYFFWYDLIRSHAVMKVFFFSVNLVAFPLLYMEWLLIFPVLGTLFLWMFLWWYVWATVMLSLSLTYLRIILAILVIGIVINLFFFF